MLLSQVRDGATLPYFLKKFLIPLLRAGQQLQVVVKLLELCNSLGTCNATHEQILPFLEDFPSEYPIFASALTFNRRNIENMALARKSYYESLQGNVENILAKKFDFVSQQVITSRSILCFQFFHYFLVITSLKWYLHNVCLLSMTCFGRFVPTLWQWELQALENKLHST